ncbi:hypothetical protein GMORB2_6199 [Geosmithia morbida]|uniref:Uncharacterized protein n=1 Tax=Geosmithia morbida TaxID=1094350 RepID=A0A9P5D155_9HYPO|nr:uncharacterized protein GMORB2_6199 [Geosmithia morbida]KAF4123498.1 hypothetical protein GMORB2_6199 [Geosmithia morbida]
MAIRERLRRVLPGSSSSNLSSSSTGSISQADSNTPATSNGSAQSSSSSSGKLTDKLPWNRSSKGKDKEQRKEDREDKKQERRRRRTTGVIHPRDKPLTESNLRHQEMLSAFDFSFGSSPSRLSQVVPPDYIGISPCCTRAPSLYLPGDDDDDDDDDDDCSPTTEESSPTVSRQNFEDS